VERLLGFPQSIIQLFRSRWRMTMAEAWFEANDPEGVAFEYQVLECAT
jgi:hypothetical protein